MKAREAQKPNLARDAAARGGDLPMDTNSWSPVCLHRGNSGTDVSFKHTSRYENGLTNLTALSSKGDS